MTRTGNPKVDVATDLREIERLAGELEAQAIAEARSHLMPGGRAMIALAPVANLEAWANLNSLTERSELSGLARAYTCADDEDPEEHWPPFQLLAFWSESWRAETGMEYDDDRWRPTLTSEASFLRLSIEWAWEHEPGWSDFARDVEAARTKLENILSEGDRAQRGVPCLYDECRGKRLVRKLEPKRGEDGSKVYDWTAWHCPRCHRKWDADQYARMVTAAAESTKVELVDGELWCTIEHAARETGRSVHTIKTWVNRQQVSVLCIRAGRRKPYVNLEEIRTRHEGSPARKRAG
jgi:hypothetical protein